ncbi:hypothetical protein RUM43_000519 [Polyplax serrata]|uniref:RRM domain-containing protein n=1 Tax=Polyplax serrata TaxID=468196 RepID=A0AAN8SCX7_POLSC
MDTISLDKNKQNEINKRVKTIKAGIKSKSIIVQENVNNRSRKPGRQTRKARGTIYLGHIPHGFYENEMMAYFSQFGKVLSATVARSKKSGRSRGFGFVEFLDEEVAKIAAETMNNYLMFNRVLKCRYIPPEERRGQRLRKIDPLEYPRKKNQVINMQMKNSSIQQLTSEELKKKAAKKIEAFKKFFENEGIDFSLKVNKLKTTETVKNTRKSKKEERNQNVMVIDESDSEIQFTTPPNVRKVIRKSCNSSILERSDKRKKEALGSKQSSVISNKKLASSVKKMVHTQQCENETPKQEKSSIKLQKRQKNLMKALSRKTPGKGPPLSSSAKLQKLTSTPLKTDIKTKPEKKATKMERSSSRSSLGMSKPKNTPQKNRSTPKKNM